MALPIPDPFVKAAEVLGTFLGNVLAAILKKAEPELRAFLIGCIRDALSSKNEVSTANASVQSIVDGVLRQDQGNLHNAGDGNDSAKGN